VKSFTDNFCVKPYQALCQLTKAQKSFDTDSTFTKLSLYTDLNP